MVKSKMRAFLKQYLDDFLHITRSGPVREGDQRHSCGQILVVGS